MRHRAQEEKRTRSEREARVRRARSTPPELNNQ